MLHNLGRTSLSIARLAAALTVIAAIVWAAPAGATVFPAIGSRGDRGEEVRCPNGHVLVGFQGRVGAWIDQIGLMCAELRVPSFTLGRVTVLPARGGPGGATAEHYCGPDGAIRNLVVHLHGWDYVRRLEFSCLRPKDGSPAGSAVFGGWSKGKEGLNGGDTFKCPGSEYATGLLINYGKHVNAIGLICSVLESRPAESAGDSSPPPKVTGLGKKPVSEQLNEGMENDTDRAGSDIHRSELQEASPGVCQARCTRLDRCKAWTYVRPGVQGPNAVCYLKDRIPQAASNKCCVSGAKPNKSAWPAIPEPVPFPSSTSPRCKPGFEPREARPADYVCVTPESRTMVAQENAVASSRWDPNGAYGPNTCIAGFVWREAFDGDVTCVTPERRAAVKEENRLAPSRTESAASPGGGSKGGGSGGQGAT